MICPVCKNDMIVVEYHDTELDYCTACEGVWFDSGELELMLKSHQTQEIQPLLENIRNTSDARSTEKKRRCPICHRRMNKKAIGDESHLLIDVCGEGHGLWFDGGEIVRLVHHVVGKSQATEESTSEVIGFLEEVFRVQ